MIDCATYVLLLPLLFFAQPTSVILRDSIAQCMLHRSPDRTTVTSTGMTRRNCRMRRELMYLVLMNTSTAKHFHPIQQWSCCLIFSCIHRIGRRICYMYLCKPRICSLFLSVSLACIVSASTFLWIISWLHLLTAMSWTRNDVGIPDSTFLSVYESWIACQMFRFVTMLRSIGIVIQVKWL